MDNMAKVDIVVRLDGIEIATQTTYIKKSPVELSDDTLITQVRLACTRGIPGMVIRGIDHIRKVCRKAKDPE